MQSWGGSQWWAFNIDTAAFGYGTKYRTVSGIAAERAELYPRYEMLRDFIDACSEKNHCMKEYTFEKMYSMDAYGAKK